MGNFTQTFYVPSGNGWTSGSFYCRFKVVQSYTSSTNKSTFTVTPQFKAAYEAGGTIISGTISAGGTTLKNFSGTSGYRANFFPDSWEDLATTNPDQPTSWTTSAISHGGNGKVTVTFACSSLKSSGVATFSGSTSKEFNGDARTYTLTVSSDAHSSVTVKKGHAVLPGGSTVTYGDVLTITANADDGYAVETFTVNGSNKTSPYTHTVSGAVSVSVTSEARGLAYIYRSGSWQAHQCYIYRSGAWVQHRPYIYKSGAWVPYG